MNDKCICSHFDSNHTGLQHLITDQDNKTICQVASCLCKQYQRSKTTHETLQGIDDMYFFLEQTKDDLNICCTVNNKFQISWRIMEEQKLCKDLPTLHFLINFANVSLTTAIQKLKFDEKNTH